MSQNKQTPPSSLTKRTISTNNKIASNNTKSVTIDNDNNKRITPTIRAEDFSTEEVTSKHFVKGRLPTYDKWGSSISNLTTRDNFDRVSLSRPEVSAQLRKNGRYKAGIGGGVSTKHAPYDEDMPPGYLAAKDVFSRTKVVSNVSSAVQGLHTRKSATTGVKHRVKKATLDDILNFADYIASCNNDNFTSKTANRGGIYYRHLDSEKCGRLFTARHKLIDPKDIAVTQPHRGNAYSMHVKRGAVDKSVKDHFVAYLPCKEMPYSFFDSEKSPATYFADPARRNRKGKASEFPVVEMSILEQLNKRRSTDGSVSQYSQRLEVTTAASFDTSSAKTSIGADDEKFTYVEPTTKKSLRKRSMLNDSIKNGDT